MVVDGAVVPESPLLKREPGNPYGSVEGLDDEELAARDELERQVYRRELEPILMLPNKDGSRPRAERVWGSEVGWGAFGSIDFSRIKPPFAKARYKAERLRKELRDVVILLSIVNEGEASLPMPSWPHVARPALGTAQALAVLLAPEDHSPLPALSAAVPARPLDPHPPLEGGGHGPGSLAVEGPLNFIPLLGLCWFLVGSVGLVGEQQASPQIAEGQGVRL